VTEDIVAVRGNGRCLCGKDELKEYLQHLLRLVDTRGQPRYHLWQCGACGSAPSFL
jgi:hypothetical protein